MTDDMQRVLELVAEAWAESGKSGRTFSTCLREAARSAGEIKQQSLADRWAAMNEAELRQECRYLFGCMGTTQHLLYEEIRRLQTRIANQRKELNGLQPAAPAPAETTAPGEIPARELAWLVERKVTPPQYIAEHCELPSLTSDPWRAIRFKTPREANDFRLRLATLRDECFVTDHMFINKPEPVSEPARAAGDDRATNPKTVDAAQAGPRLAASPGSTSTASSPVSHPHPEELRRVDPLDKFEPTPPDAAQGKPTKTLHATLFGNDCVYLMDWRSDIWRVCIEWDGMPRVEKYGTNCISWPREIVDEHERCKPRPTTTGESGLREPTVGEVRAVAPIFYHLMTHKTVPTTPTEKAADDAFRRIARANTRSTTRAMEGDGAVIEMVTRRLRLIAGGHVADIVVLKQWCVDAADLFDRLHSTATQADGGTK